MSCVCRHTGTHTHRRTHTQTYLIYDKNRENFWLFQYFFVLLLYQSVRFNRKRKFIMKIIVSEEIESVCPTFVGACVEANVVNTPYCQELWDEIHALGEKYKETLTTESLKEMSGIAATRKVYRACGKGSFTLSPCFRSPHPKNAAGQGTLSKRYAGGLGKSGKHRIRLQYRRF